MCVACMRVAACEAACLYLCESDFVIMYTCIHRRYVCVCGCVCVVACVWLRVCI